MLALKYAIKNISRSLGRNILIGLIVLVISAASFVAFSIMDSANQARQKSVDILDLTAHINVDRQYLMQNVGQMTPGSTPDKAEMAAALSEAAGMSLDALQEYAKKDYVKDFYYELTATVNGSGELEPIDVNGVSNDAMTQDLPPMMGGLNAPPMSNPMTMMGTQGDFSLIGYSEDQAMEDFVTGTCYIVEGTMFAEGTAEYQCVISDELATYNTIAVGDEIVLENPNNEEETITVSVVGIYHNDSASQNTEAVFSTSSDPANEILMSYNALHAILEASKMAATADGNSEYSDEIRGNTVGSFILPDVTAYDAFEADLAAGEEEGKYVLTSTDIANYESSLIPLNNLKKFALSFLVVILVIGIIVMFILNLFNIRDRKYEIGVLMAIGMRKTKIAAQFVWEVFIVTLVALLVGTCIGIQVSSPVANNLLATQIEQQESSQQSVMANYGRPVGPQQQPQIGSGTMIRGGDVDGPVDYVSTVSSSVNLMLIAKMILVGIGLTIVSSSIAVLFIMRYEPLKVLSNRD